MLALATCYCNESYRESARLGIPSAPPEAIATLLRETDAVAEVHNTLRAGVDVSLEICNDDMTPARRST
jgi:hypothetical protein